MNGIQQKQVSALLALGVPRFIIAGRESMTKKERSAGYTHSVVDGAHPSDGGPVAISFHFSRTEAEIALSACVRTRSQP